MSGNLESKAQKTGTPRSKHSKLAREESNLAPPVIALSVRLPKPMYDALLGIVYEAKKKGGEKVSIHSLMLEGIAKVIAEKR
jgi:hypothetical protein